MCFELELKEREILQETGEREGSDYKGEPCELNKTENFVELGWSLNHCRREGKIR